MSGFILTQKAVADLKGIGRSTQQQWGHKQRVVYLTMLDACFHQLSENPLHGKDCFEIRAGYRKQTVGSHVIFYRCLSDDLIEIVRVLHGHMDIESRLSNR